MPGLRSAGAGFGGDRRDVCRAQCLRAVEILRAAFLQDADNVDDGFGVFQRALSRRADQDISRGELELPDVAGEFDVTREARAAGSDPHAPALGGDTDDVLGGLGLSADEIERLRTRGVI